MSEPNPLAGYLPGYLRRYILTLVQEQTGIDFKTEHLVTGVEGEDVVPDTEVSTGAEGWPHGSEQSRVTLGLVGRDRLPLDTDFVVLATTKLAPELINLGDDDSCLETIDGGIATNGSLEAFNWLFVLGMPLHSSSQESGTTVLRHTTMRSTQGSLPRTNMFAHRVGKICPRSSWTSLPSGHE